MSAVVATLDALPQRLQQTRESIQSTVDQIEACFIEGDSAADQIGRACDLLLEFARQFGVDDKHRREAILQKSMFNDLLSRDRMEQLTSEQLRTESVKIRLRVLELVHEMAGTARSHLDKIGTVPVANNAAASKAPVSAVLPQSALRDSLEKFLTGDSAHGVAFRCKRLGKRFGLAGGPFIIRDIEIDLRNGEITGLIGLNGSGKTTMLRIIGGLLQATTGEREYPALKCSSNDWVTIRRSIAFVAQRPERWTGTVREALSLQAACFGNPGERGRRLVDFYLARLGLTMYEHFTWAQLSGGYRTRFELAKAMLSRPKMLILDEPLAALDIPAQLRFLTDLRDFATTFGEPMPVLISSQHIYEVEAIADRMIVIRDGTAIYNGPTEAIGEGRAINGFEVSCDLGTLAITSALEPLAILSIQKIGPNECFIKADRSVQAAQVIGALTRAHATIRHFRDTSGSSRMFFEA
jgi:ABC-2 type transport system ATP-binding protein